MGGQRAFLEDHALESASVIFEQFGGAEIACDQYGVAAKPGLGGGAELAGNDSEQPVGEVVEIVHPLGEQGIVDFAHPHPGALLDPLDRRFGGEAGIDRLVDPPRPALVVGEHLVGREYLIVLAGRSELGEVRHIVDLLAHLAERRIDPVALGLGILGDGMLDQHPGLMIDSGAAGHAGHQLEARQTYRAGIPLGGRGRRLVGEAGIGDQLGQDHRHGLKRLDLDIVIGAGFGMLNAEHSNRTLAPDDRDSGEAVEQFLAGFRPIGEFRVAARFVEVEHRHLVGDRSDQALAHRQPRDVDRALVEADGGEQFEHSVAQQIDRAYLARHRLCDDLHDLVELHLRVGARGHHVVKAGQYYPG
jgi:hypothetical protein